MGIFFPNSWKKDGNTDIFPTHGVLEIFPEKPKEILLSGGDVSTEKLFNDKQQYKKLKQCVWKF